MYESQTSHYYAVIMAGGGGTRLWPISRQASPKQMLHLIGEQSLFQIAVERLQGLFPYERILVVTIAEQIADLREQCPEIPGENYLIEPMPRGTASVVGLAAIALQIRDPQAVMAILTADHHIGNEPGFRSILVAAHDLAKQGYLVTLGITPTFPSTGYGYIQKGEQITKVRGHAVNKVLRFKEKPDDETAERMIAAGDHVWNSGMFIWSVAQIFDEFKRQMPELHLGLGRIHEAGETERRQEIVRQVWEELTPQTIDYGVMEGAANVAVIPAADLEWNDVGSWESLFDVLPADDNGNIVRGARHIGLDTQGTLVYVDGSDRLVVTIGVQDLVVVDSGDVILVCHKDEAQRVRQIVKILKDQGNEYL